MTFPRCVARDLYTRSSGLAKTVLQGTVQGERRRGRQRKRWEDNIKEWTGLEWNIILRKAENREEWRNLVVKSTVVPQRSARLRDRSEDKKGTTTPLQIHSPQKTQLCGIYCLKKPQQKCLTVTISLQIIGLPDYGIDEIRSKVEAKPVAASVTDRPISTLTY